MTHRTTVLAIVAGAFVALAGCGPQSDTEPPAPVAMTEEALGHFCQMVVLEHPGPKAQIHLAGQPAPVFFSQVRDGVAYYKSPERDYDIVAFYVTDMAQAASWDNPGPENWLNVTDAHFVVGSGVRGGMGAPELVPFGSREAAEQFVEREGGEVMTLDQIPEDAVFGIVEISAINGSTGK